MIRFLYLIILIISFSACEIPSEKQLSKNNFFFDLEDYFKKEAAFLNKQNIKINKVIRHNQNTEKHLVEVKDWLQEFQLFIDRDINKASWRDKYDLDSSNIGNGLTLLHYKANDKSLNTQVLDVEYKGSEIHSIVVVSNISNQIYESQQYLTYIPRKSYSIEKTQNVSFSKKEEYNIQATFVKS